MWNQFKAIVNMQNLYRGCVLYAQLLAAMGYASLNQPTLEIGVDQLDVPPNTPYTAEWFPSSYLLTNFSRIR